MRIKERKKQDKYVYIYIYSIFIIPLSESLCLYMQICMHMQMWACLLFVLNPELTNAGTNN